MCLLLLPKILGASLFIRQPDKLQAGGGRVRIYAGVLAEAAFSMILAPILMLFYSRFVCATFSGAGITWGRQRRADEQGPSWRELVAAHSGHAILALAWAGTVAGLAPTLLPWLAPVLIGPLMAIPFSRIIASTRLGRRARERSWFVVPEETQPPIEFQRLREPFTEYAGPHFPTKDCAADFGMLQAILDPYVNALHVFLLRQRHQISLRTHEYMIALTDRLLLDGPFALTPREKRVLLWDRDSMRAAHLKLWASPGSHLHDWWRAALRHYSESNALKTRRSVSTL
jgi:membrane glycosyltransferase